MNSPVSSTSTLPPIVRKALEQNLFLHKYVMALDHALLWIAALSLAAFFHLSPDFSKSEALLFSTLVAYGVSSAFLFLLVFVVSVILTRRNRHIIQEHTPSEINNAVK